MLPARPQHLRTLFLPRSATGGPTACARSLKEKGSEDILRSLYEDTKLPRVSKVNEMEWATDMAAKWIAASHSSLGSRWLPARDSRLRRSAEVSKLIKRWDGGMAKYFLGCAERSVVNVSNEAFASKPYSAPFLHPGRLHGEKATDCGNE